MPENFYNTIVRLLESNNAAGIRKGLSMLSKEDRGLNRENLNHILEILMSFFYIDALDRPDLISVVDEVISTIASMGEWVIPVLIKNLAAGDLKSQMAVAHALGRIGEKAIMPLIAEFSLAADSSQRSFLIYALSKIKAPEIISALDLVMSCTTSGNLELRDTATRVMGKLAETIPANQIPREKIQKIVACLHTYMSDVNPCIRAKAVRSLGKFAKYQHLSPEEIQMLITACRQLLGEDNNFNWDHAYIVRKEAKDALSFVEEYSV